MINQYNAGRAVKGFYSASLAFLASLAAVLQGPEPISAVTAAQWVTIAAFTLTAFGGAFGLAGWQGPSGPGIKPNGTP